MSSLNAEFALGSAFTTGSMAVFTSKETMEKTRLDRLCSDVNNFIKKKKGVDIPEIIEEFSIPADLAIKVIKILESKGLIQLVD